MRNEGRRNLFWARRLSGFCISGIELSCSASFRFLSKIYLCSSRLIELMVHNITYCGTLLLTFCRLKY
jgi:hypothetical protein